MLPLQLLRVRTRKGVIFPLFCTEEKDLQIAEGLVREFRESALKKEQKKLLDKRVAEVEAQQDDYKLVRGFSTLLERRCQFSSMISHDESNDDGSGKSNDLLGLHDPVSIRKELFEESSRAGFAVTDMERDSILDTVASKLKLSSSYIKQAMWSDLEENMVLEKFDVIESKILVEWYNLSLMQTLLFNCTRLEFSVNGGANWKRVLRNVKRFGLMYNLQQREQKVQQEQDANSKNSKNYQTSAKDDSHNTTDLVCSLDGPLSVFKLTDRYGTSIAKLLPSIVSSETWFLDASIVRKTMSGKKIYEFKTASTEVPSSLTNPNSNYNHSDKSAAQFDSSVEEKFASRFEQSVGDSGWKLVREPDPIVVSNGRAFIPDFVFEKYGRKVYLEIVGFWTKDYIERKMQKLKDVVSSKSVDLFIAVNEQLACSKFATSSSPTSLSSSLPQERIIFYKNDSVPVKPILDYLKSIDKEQIKRDANDSNLKIKFDGAKDIISIDEIISAIRNTIPMESAIAIASRDNENDYLKAGPCFISKSKVDKVASLLAGTTKFQDACSIFSENSIPEPCHAELIAKLGYDVLWESLDSTNALIVKRKTQTQVGK